MGLTLRSGPHIMGMRAIFWVEKKEQRTTTILYHHRAKRGTRLRAPAAPEVLVIVNLKMLVDTTIRNKLKLIVQLIG